MIGNRYTSWFGATQVTGTVHEVYTSPDGTQMVSYTFIGGTLGGAGAATMTSFLRSWKPSKNRHAP